MTIPNYYQLPDIPDAGLLTRYLGALGVVVPLARSNLVLNPVLKNNSTGWTALNASCLFSSGIPGDFLYDGFGALCQLNVSGAQFGIYYSIALTAGVTYAISVGFRRTQFTRDGVYALAVATTGNADLTVYRFQATNYWQWIWLLHRETSSTTRRIIIRRDDTGGVSSGGSGDDFFRISGLQVESCADGVLVPTTYIDGDQRGLVPNQYPPAYGWNGTPHASTSYRSGQTRAGGRIMRFRDFGFLLTTIIGLGLASPTHEALTFAQLDGGQYQNTIKPPRQFSLAGRWVGTQPADVDVGMAQLGRMLDRDYVGQRQPLVLTNQSREETPGEPIAIQALYQSGLEGTVFESPTAQTPITFTQYIPYVIGPDRGTNLDVQDTPSGSILYRPPLGSWQALSTGVSGGTAIVYAIVVGLDGLVYVGGNFTAAGATSADFIASWNPVTQAWAVLGSATALNAEVRALAVGPDGRIYVGGSFTNASGIAAADFVAVWNPTTAAWAALSTGMNAVVYALAWSGSTLYAGGNFTTAGGGAAARIAAWDGAAWSALGTGANANVFALAAAPGSLLYIGGEFTNGGGVANADRIGSWDGSSWGALSTGMDAEVYTLAIAPDSTLYAGGVFQSAGGVSAFGIAAWNGISWRQLGQGFESPGISAPLAFAVRPDGTLLIAANAPVADPGAPGPVLEWNGSAFVSLGITMAGADNSAIAVAPDGTIYAATSGVTAALGVTTPVINQGTAQAFPRLTIKGPTTGSSRIYELHNLSTGASIYFNYTIQAGETAVLILDPTNISFTSTFQGNILSTILPGSDTTLFSINPTPEPGDPSNLYAGADAIGFFAANSTVTAVLDWQTGYLTLADALYRTLP